MFVMLAVPNLVFLDEIVGYPNSAQCARALNLVILARKQCLSHKINFKRTHN